VIRPWPKARFADNAAYNFPKPDIWLASASVERKARDSNDEEIDTIQQTFRTT
jgi:hypothetical protein